ncbi:hypothetical protein T492DRAFT_524257 [Pavlovales sp. CCMP2436]|nr:hypothetical protein T492DRAFT_524257 [Pavlovales sp. CCMP2436]
MPVTLRSRGDGTPGKAAQSPSSKSTPSKAKPEATTSDAVDAAAEPGHLLIPKTTEFEFGGPLGAMAVVVCLPALVFVLAASCDSSYCIPFKFELPRTMLERVPQLFASAFELDAMAVILAWMALQVIRYNFKMKISHWGGGML